MGCANSKTIDSTKSSMDTWSSKIMQLVKAGYPEALRDFYQFKVADVVALLDEVHGDYMTEVSKAEATDIKQTAEVEAANSKVDTSCKKIEEEFKNFQKQVR